MSDKKPIRKSNRPRIEDKRLNKFRHYLKKVSSSSIGKQMPGSFPQDVKKKYLSGIYVSYGFKADFYEFPGVEGCEIFPCPPGHSAYISKDVPSYGVRALRFYKKGDLIGYYAGEFRLTNELRPENPYCLSIQKRIVVDALHCGNELAFINDPRESADVLNRDKANVDCNSDIFLRNGTVETYAVVAIKDIQPDEELLWSYGKSYWNTYSKEIYAAKKAASEKPSVVEKPIIENPVELTLEKFFLKHVKEGSSVSKKDVRKHFKRMSPTIFKAEFVEGYSDHGTKLVFGDKFSRLLKKHFPNLGSMTSPNYKGIHLDFRNPNPVEQPVLYDEYTNQDKDEEQPFVIDLVSPQPPRKKRDRAQEDAPVKEEAAQEPPQKDQKVVDLILGLQDFLGESLKSFNN